MNAHVRFRSDAKEKLAWAIFISLKLLTSYCITSAEFFQPISVIYFGFVRNFVRHRQALQTGAACFRPDGKAFAVLVYAKRDKVCVEFLKKGRQN